MGEPITDIQALHSLIHRNIRQSESGLVWASSAAQLPVKGSFQQFGGLDGLMPMIAYMEQDAPVRSLDVAMTMRNGLNALAGRKIATLSTLSIPWQIDLVQLVANGRTVNLPGHVFTTSNSTVVDPILMRQPVSKGRYQNNLSPQDSSALFKEYPY
ncbi:MAG TPA: hypothetical protein PKU95_01220 [Candidatus Dojkabacteria bacterium]|nr:hypothetical protein [Candidatus Dojkabacteria bacterium]